MIFCKLFWVDDQIIRRLLIAKFDLVIESSEIEYIKQKSFNSSVPVIRIALLTG